MTSLVVDLYPSRILPAPIFLQVFDSEALGGIVKRSLAMALLRYG